MKWHHKFQQQFRDCTMPTDRTQNVFSEVGCLAMWIQADIMPTPNVPRHPNRRCVGHHTEEVTSLLRQVHGQWPNSIHNEYRR
jgi:hypothetical protein